MADRFHRVTLVTTLAFLGFVFGWIWMLSADPVTDDKSSTDTTPQAESSVKEAYLPAPSSLSVSEFEEKLFAFLNEKQYVKLGWKDDGRLRDTGPYINGKYYGTHPAVRVYYSPEIIEWLESGRNGRIPDGAMIVKEQYPPPAIRHAGQDEQQLWDALESWTVMVKDSKGSHDGWFWSNPGKGQDVLDNHADVSHPTSGFGLYCIRCHASTHSPLAKPDSPDNEFTFASLRNIEGYPGEPILFRVDDSWRDEKKTEPEESESTSESEKLADTSQDSGAHPSCIRSGGVTICDAEINPEFLEYYDSVIPVTRDGVSVLPPVTHDWVAKRRDQSQEFVTSNQCMSCHSGLLEPYGPTMFIPTGENKEYGAAGWNISPYGEWRWTPMGLAGRDPVFLAQLESELKLLQQEFGQTPKKANRLQSILQDTCLKCHGAMGRHQFNCDQDGQLATFGIRYCESIAESDEHIGLEDSKYGALARDGISCMVCHRMQQRPQPPDDDRPYLQFFLETSVTGNLFFGPPNEIYGPYKDQEITPYVMQHALGITPKQNPFIKSSQMCGSCHTVTLPAVDKPVTAEHFDELNDSQVVEEFQSFHHHVEQATYLEWLNSEFENEFNPDNPKGQSCQDCHMSKDLVDENSGINLESLVTRMAIIQDATYPDAENLASQELLDVRIRKQGYSRHNFSGLNVFLLELFDQFPDVLGVRPQDYMTGSNLDIEHARQNFLLTASKKTADIDVQTHWHPLGELTAHVTVNNKTGHRFPSGVGFRRAFLEFLVLEKNQNPDNAEKILWSSGRTNNLGVLINHTGQILTTERGEKSLGHLETHQPHHQEITKSDQVQIYESLLCNAQGGFTTSFLHGCKTIKDNRLLPRGWSKQGPDPALSGRYLEATHPQGLAVKDESYRDGSGSDSVTYRVRLPGDVDPNNVTVRATLYYQALPPYFLNNLFKTAPDGKQTQRLHFLLSHVDTKGTPIEQWKLKVVSAEADITQ